jgi:ABC-type Mn2+/Zn2+ transport system permease subunit
MLLARRGIQAVWLPTAGLVLSTGLAAVGILSGGQPFLLALGVMAALASWDLVLLENSLGGGPPQQAAFFEGRHLKSLALAIGLGTLGVAVGVGGALQLSLPFGGLILLVALILFCLDRLIHTQVDQR